MSRPLRVLIVEDSEDDALLVLDELRGGGYDPVFERVETRQAMQAALGRHAWDLIIADYRLPSFTGLDALEMACGCSDDCPFIIVSGQISEETAVSAMRAGAKDYVLKDNLARLVPAVERELREAAFRRDAREAHEALHRSELVLQSIIDSSNAAIYLKDLNGRFIIANDASAAALGTTREEAIGKTDHDFLPAELAQNHEANDREVARTRTPREYEEAVVQQDGLHTYVSAKFPVYDGSGEVYAVGGISTDITQRKLTEEELARSRIALEEALDRERHFSLLLQRALLPREPGIGAGYEVAAEYVPAFQSREIGGDFYDVVRVTDCRAGVLIGDVSGKGLEAAAMAAATRSTINAFVHETSSAAEALERANAVLYSRQEEFQSFVTVFLMVIDLCTGEVRYANAGHPPAAICRSDGRFEFVRCGKLPLAIVESQTFDECHTTFDVGDKIILYTDGISEARRRGDLLELEGVQSLLSRHAALPADQLAHALVTGATDWAEGTLADDAAVLVVEKTV